MVTEFRELTAGLIGCAEQPTAVPTQAASPVKRDVVVAIGARFFDFAANNNGAEFWDNTSGDGVQCNVGYYVTGPFGDPTLPWRCAYSLVTPPANAATFGSSQFYGASGGAKPAPFTFDAGTYEVVFLDGFRGYGREPVGWFTKSGGNYALNPIDPAVSSLVNGVVTFTSSAPWGFWIQPTEAISGGDGCFDGTTTNAMCSDDTRVQQFALFKKLDNSKFLVGIEDEPGVAVQTGITPTAKSFPYGGGDKDFNDFFLSVRKVADVETLDGRMTGGGTTDAASKLSVSLTIHCDNKLSNNIQINWVSDAGKMDWHLDKNSLTNVICQLVSDPRPPAAPINIFGGNATGTLNKATGSKLQFKFVDNGEPNQGGDRVSLKIWDTNNKVVLDVQNALLNTGNFQAHYDQPHGQKP